MTRLTQKTGYTFKNGQINAVFSIDAITPRAALSGLPSQAL
jgi:hypothetical protein